jgi:ABC-2 type transport system permease protein
MKNQIVSEYRKLTTTRTAWGLLVGLLALVAVGVVGVMWDAGPAALAAPLGAGPFLSVALGVTWAFVMILGLRSFTDEFRYGSIVPTLLADPERRRVLAAKLVVTAGAATVFALAAAALSLAIGATWLVIEGVAIEVALGPLAVWFGKLLLVNVLWSAIGVGVGLAVRHQVAAIVGSLVGVLIVENLLAGLAPAIGGYLPGEASAAVVGISGALLAPVAGAVVLAAWAAAAVGVGGVLARHDIA